eukprot:6293720-Amphidinium_carterae.1
MNRLPSKLAKVGETHGELGKTAMQCQFLKMSLTMFAKVRSLDSDERDAALARQSHRSLTASNPKQSFVLFEAIWKKAASLQVI